ncbi:MAG: hypothetical protein Q7T20_01995 [Saprospiraceae bacterium]|nr:hypothetical protein [Saprospiraceae bacterium]
MNFARLLLLTLWATSADAQPGCPDPQATNYNPSATSNDGSCLYPVTTYAPVLKAELPGDLREISGLTHADSKWWGHNDSGFNEEFFNIDPETGDILQKIELINANNRDWEDITSDSLHLYMGDFGNNTNDRQNLGIYIVPLSAIGNSNPETVQEFEWSFLPFSYIDQTNFMTLPDDSSVYDCEAMIFHNNQIHLFTKSRRNYNTVHYALNTSTNVADKVEIFDAQGLITGASLSPDGKLIALVGYDLRPFIPTVFCWLLWDWQPGTDLFFTGNRRRIELGTALQIGQVESIGFGSNRTGYMSNERTSFNGVTIVEESVWNFDFSPWVPGSVGTEAPGGEPEAFIVFPNPFSQTIHFQYFGNKKFDFLIVKNQLGQTVLTLKDLPETLDMGFLIPGYYSFETWKDGRQTGRVKGLKR